jgi:hypothetical protein
MQYIIVCLRDRSPEHPSTYVQATRRRFIEECNAYKYSNMFSKERSPIILEVPEVKLDEDGYPIFTP